MAKVTFYPIGNADCNLLEFADERIMLIDYCHRKDANDENDKRVDLQGELRSVLEEKDRNYFDVVGFTHADDDHVGASEDFFWLEHAEKYQGDDRLKIRQLWVPACFILESGLEGSARVIRQEARCRLINGKGIRVFGNPGVLDDWLKNNGIEPKKRAHLLTRAGECVPEFKREKGQSEIFVHAPFSFRIEGEDVLRNDNSLVLHITFFEDDAISRVMLGADAEHQAWSDIVHITRRKSNSERLFWDAFKISHHCSYTALSSEKGRDKTEPIKNVRTLFEHGQDGCYLISSSNPIPSRDTDQPPHKQAAAYYEEITEKRNGQFLVTMQSPNTNEPKPIVIEAGKNGLTWKKITGVATGVGAVISRPSQRQG